MLREGIHCWGKITKRAAEQLPVVVFPKVSVSALTRHVKHCEGKTTHAGEKTETCSIKVLLLFYIDKVQLKKIPWGIAVDCETPTSTSWTSLCWSQWSVQCLAPGPKKSNENVFRDSVSIDGDQWETEIVIQILIKNNDRMLLNGTAGNWQDSHWRAWGGWWWSFCRCCPGPDTRRSPPSSVPAIQPTCQTAPLANSNHMLLVWHEKRRRETE